MERETIEQPGVLDTDAILVRTMREGDLDDVVSIDAAGAGRRRPEYYARLLELALKHAGVKVSLVAEAEGRVVGFVVATLFYGEFGLAEPTATIDAIAVDPAWRRRHAARALLRQLRLNVGALGIARLRTEVGWDDFSLLAFLRDEGFEPAQRLCLERPLDPTTPGD